MQKPALAMFGFLLCALLAGCGDDNVTGTHNRDQEARAPFSYAVAIEDQTGILLESINGAITVGTTARDSVLIEGERIVKSTSLEDAEDHLQDLSIELSTADDQLVVRSVHHDNSGKRDYQVDYSIRIPASWGVGVEEVNGTVAVDSISGATTVELINGIILLDEITGDTDVRLTNGTLTARVALRPAGSCAMRVINGTLGLSIPRQTSATLSATAVNGSITTSGLDLNDLTTTPTSLSGTLGGGNGSIELNTTNGTIGITGY